MKALKKVEHEQIRDSVRQLQRIGDTVRRPRDENSDFVARLLTYLQEVGFAAAPRYLGVDDRARDIFTYVAGRTTNHPSQCATQPWADS